MRIYNTLTRKIEEFEPFNMPKVGMYTCGPTVYDFAHIGNWRTYILSDTLRRTLKYLRYEVTAVSNVTDVGHLVSDSDEGEDKLEKGARREGKTAWDIAKKYTDIYYEHEKKLNILKPDYRCKATDYIREQTKLIGTLEKKGFTYKTSDGIYFDTSRFPDYGKLTNQDKDKILEGARVEVNSEKRNATDFALWKFSPTGVKRQMEWKSPWGIGFPGWHIECSAMNMKHLGEQFELHLGGDDLKFIHHNNEIAQSEAASGKVPFVKYWVHGQFLTVDSQKMSKSKGNFYNLDDIVNKGFDPLALRYLFMTSHYRSFLNFTWEGLKAVQNGLNNLRSILMEGSHPSMSGRTTLSEEKLGKIQEYSARFRQAIENDLNLPEALAIVWEMAKSNIPKVDKADLARDFDEVLGLDLLRSDKGLSFQNEGQSLKDLPAGVLELVSQRESARQSGDFVKADQIRNKINKLGWSAEDTPGGPRLKNRV